MRRDNQRRPLTQKQWEFVVQKVPMPCVDIIVAKKKEILMGLRAFSPYNNVWALPGGVIRKTESPRQTIKRVLSENAVTASAGELVDVFPIRFPRNPLKRYDISLCYFSRWVSGEPKPSKELTRLAWFAPRSLPSSMGLNYRRMIKQAIRAGHI